MNAEKQKKNHYECEKECSWKPGTRACEIDGYLKVILVIQ